MNATVEDLRPTIVPRSDQLNSEQLLGTTMTITVTDVTMGSSEQPVTVHYAGEEGRPFKPGKTSRKVLIFAWGENGRNWVGKSMTLYCDERVMFGGEKVGGIRISHLSHIDKEIAISLTATKGKKAMHTIKVLRDSPELVAALAAITAATDKASMSAAAALAKRLTLPAEIATAQGSYSAKVAALKKSASKSTAFDLAAFATRAKACADVEQLQVLSDEAEAMTEGPDKAAALEILQERDAELLPPA